MAVALSPVAAFFVLRLALMSPPDLNDPAMHTTFLLDPHDIFLRYTELFTPTSRLREGARVGFLVPGRISELLFGPFPGFVVYRYLLALIAVVPTYALLRRLYGIAAGVVGAIIVLSCPVIITAWGTDFPDSAGVSYIIGGIACLAMPATRRRTAWLVASALLFTMAVWTFASSAPLIIVTLVVYVLIRRAREPSGLRRDAVVVAATGAAVTVLLALGSRWLLGPFDYVSTTIRSLIYLSHPSQEAIWHSVNWRWAPYVAYLLVPPGIVITWLIAFGRRLRAIPTPQLFVGLACASQLALSVLLQFVGKVQMLEMHYFSSMLWASVVLTFAISLSELSRPLLARRVARWALPLVLLVVPLLYEIHPQVPAFGWLPFGFLLLGAVGVFAGVAKYVGRVWRASAAQFAGVAACTLVAGCVLILTVAPIPNHPYIPATTGDPPPAYASALGGDTAHYVDLYRATSELPAFAGNAAYSGEQLVMWWPWAQVNQLLEPIGIFHAFFDSVPGSFGALDISGRQWIERRRPAQMLLLSDTGAQFEESLASLAGYGPHLVRSGVLRSGDVSLHAWLIDLGRYIRASAQ